ncbi:hypothetical protein DPMN_078265 [Dreissena polymorpha]|uniref:Methyltransferase FkbM domain-containing protein n=1 Tax=Dreissena polymorpha TaxID=45954 RepID=A0A9D4BP09_DREPO|nr:hypothetical protein DPMN_078265 [Dreissena polymorpha]
MGQSGTETSSLLQQKLLPMVSFSYFSRSYFPWCHSATSIEVTSHGVIQLLQQKLLPMVSFSYFNRSYFPWFDVKADWTSCFRPESKIHTHSQRSHSAGFSLFDILNVIGTRQVDYFSLDVEGAELYILES